jgi:hypothetical protein
LGWRWTYPVKEVILLQEAEVDAATLLFLAFCFVVLD